MLTDSDDDTLAPAAAEAPPEEREGAVAAEAPSPLPADERVVPGEPHAKVDGAPLDVDEPIALEALGPAAVAAQAVAVTGAAVPDAAASAVPAVLPFIPLPPPPPPKPKPPIRPERLVADSGDVSYRTDGILIERGQSRAFFVTISPPQGSAQRIYVHAHAFEQLLRLSEGPAWETGRLWKALCEIPLDRPLPSRRLEEELRALLTTFAGELHR